MAFLKSNILGPPCRVAALGHFQPVAIVTGEGPLRVERVD